MPPGNWLVGDRLFWTWAEFRDEVEADSAPQLNCWNSAKP
jgi:hypothetical protein